MKKLMRVITAILAFALLFAASAALAAEGAFAFLGSEYVAFADGFEQNTPVAVCYTEHTMGGGPDSYLWDEASVRAVFAALSGLQVGQKDEMLVTDSDRIFSFIMADGSRVSLLFNQDYLEKDGARYKVDNADALWDIEFPCYGVYKNLFDVFADPDISAFASGYDDAPATSVSFRRGNGDTSVVEDEAFARKVFEAMSTAEAMWVEDDQYFDASAAEESCFTFRMPDGSEYAFTLYSTEAKDGSLRDCVAVQPPVAALGTQYYSLESTNAIWALQFEGYESIKGEHGVTDDLMPLFGPEYEAKFAFGNNGEFTQATVVRRSGGEILDEVTFLETDYWAASDMALEMSQMNCLAPLSTAPDSDETCTFIFTDSDGKEYTFEFIGNCAAIPDGNGGVSYYPIEHGLIDEGGVWDIVTNEQELLAWKQEVDFGGDGDDNSGLYGALLTAAAAAVFIAVILLVVRLAKRNADKKKGNAD